MESFEHLAKCARVLKAPVAESWDCPHNEACALGHHRRVVTGNPWGAQQIRTEGLVSQRRERPRVGCAQAKKGPKRGALSRGMKLEGRVGSLTADHDNHMTIARPWVAPVEFRICGA